MNFKLLTPKGQVVNQNTTIAKYGGDYKISTEKQLCRFMKVYWCVFVGVKSFQAWADDLNESGDYESEFTKYDAVDSMSSAFHLEVNGESVNIYDYFLQHHPFKDDVVTEQAPETQPEPEPQPEPKNFFSFEEMKNSFIYCLIGKLDGLMTWGLYHIGEYKGGSKLMATSDEILPSDHIWFRNNLPYYQSIKN